MLTNRQKEAARLLCKGCKVKEIAAMLHVHRSTLWRWWQRPEMRRYCERYCKRETARIFAAPNPLLEELNSPDPWKAERTAVRIIDLYSWAILGTGKPPF